jgi:hypothetical protein
MFKVVWWHILDGSQQREFANPGEAKTVFRCLCGAANVESVLWYDESGNCIDSWGT